MYSLIAVGNTFVPANYAVNGGLIEPTRLNGRTYIVCKCDGWERV